MKMLLFFLPLFFVQKVIVCVIVLLFIHSFIHSTHLFIYWWCWFENSWFWKILRFHSFMRYCCKSSISFLWLRLLLYYFVLFCFYIPLSFPSLVVCVLRKRFSHSLLFHFFILLLFPLIFCVRWSKPNWFTLCLCLDRLYFFYSDSFLLLSLLYCLDVILSDSFQKMSMFPGGLPLSPFPSLLFSLPALFLLWEWWSVTPPPTP